MLASIHTLCSALLATVRCGHPAPQDDCSERGDVPGWVLITLMTAGIVVAIWTVASPALVGLFQSALDRVSGLL